MTHCSGVARAIFVIVLVAAFAAGGVVLFRSQFRKEPIATTQPLPTTVPVTQPSTAPTPPPKPADYMDVVLRTYPEFPTTQALMVPVGLAEAARIVLNDPVYLDPLGELWITRGDADSTVHVLQEANKRTTHVTKERVVYVHRWPDETGVWQPQLICLKPGGRYEIVTKLSRFDIPGSYNYDWPRASSWNDAIVVPTDRGVSVIRPERRPMELHHDFFPAEGFEAATHSPVQALLDWRGLLAWMPWENGKTGSEGAARLVGETWTTLGTAQGWPTRIVHLVPLLDGSVLQIVVDEKNEAFVEIAALDANPKAMDEAKVASLVEQLSDPDSTVRVNSFNQLSLFGPSIWPLLERLQVDQPPEAQIRIQQLLSNKTQPTLAGMLLQPGPITVMARSNNGALVIRSEAGVLIPREGQEDLPPISPAWIIVDPGRAIELAPGALVEAMAVNGRRLESVRGERIVFDDAEGPRWWLSNHLTPPLLKGKNLEFKHLVGQDQRGRWLLRRSADELVPTLVLDPTLPDPAPRLPVWVYSVEGMQAGWTADDWPAIKRGGGWALVNADWKPLKEGVDKFLTAADLPKSAPIAPTTTTTTGPATRETLGPPIWMDADGTNFYGGTDHLLMIRPDGSQTRWALPPEAIGTIEPRLFRAGDQKRLFLFNSPGKLLRIQQTSTSAEPFKLEATFTNKIPNADHPDRVWLDPAGRIVFAYGGSSLAICFPNGRIPPDMAKKMTAKELQEADE